jgi:hypothetical protein
LLTQKGSSARAGMHLERLHSEVPRSDLADL